MKHILNNLTEEEKNSIRKQHTGGMNLMVENFNKLISSKSGEIKPLVSEQSKSSSIDESLKIWGNKIGEELSRTQIVAQKVNVSGEPIPGDTIDSYFIDGISDSMVSTSTFEKVESLYDLNYVDVTFNAHILNENRKGIKKIQLVIHFLMSKGFAVGISGVSIMGEDSFLDPKSFTKSIIPKISKIQLKNPCFEGYTYYGPNTGEVTNIKGLRMTNEKFVKYDSNDNEIRLYKDKGDWNSGTGQIRPKNIESGGKIQEISWACSNGKLTINKM